MNDRAEPRPASAAPTATPQAAAPIGRGTGGAPLTPTEPRAEPQRNPGLELFFDLVFVLCVTQLADVLHESPTWSTALKVGLLFVPVWWT